LAFCSGAGYVCSSACNSGWETLISTPAYLTVHGKGKKDRTVPLPHTIIPALKAQIEDVGKLHDQDFVDGYDGVFLEGSHVTEKQGFLRKTMNFKKKR